MGAAALFVHSVFIFHGFRRIIFGVIRNEVLKLHWMLNFIWVIDISGGLQFTAVLSTNTTSDGD